MNTKSLKQCFDADKTHVLVTSPVNPEKNCETQPLNKDRLDQSDALSHLALSYFTNVLQFPYGGNMDDLS